MTSAGGLGQVSTIPASRRGSRLPPTARDLRLPAPVGWTERARQRGVLAAGPPSASSRFLSDFSMQGRGSRGHQIKHVCNYLELWLSSSLFPRSHGGMTSALAYPSKPASNAPSSTQPSLNWSTGCRLGPTVPTTGKRQTDKRFSLFLLACWMQRPNFNCSQKLIFEHLLYAGGTVLGPGTMDESLSPKIPQYGGRER